MLHACSSAPVTKLAFEWLVLTATRSGETRGAVWSEIDEAKAIWVIPKSRMKKGRREHIVPLSDRCLAIAKEARALNPCSALLFPSASGKPLSDMTFTKLPHDRGLSDRATAHGFRSSFRDWTTETNQCREVVAEAARRTRSKTKLRQPTADHLILKSGPPSCSAGPNTGSSNSLPSARHGLAATAPVAFRKISDRFDPCL
jgi:integrase